MAQAGYDPTNPTPYQAPQLPQVQAPAPSPLPPPDQGKDFGGTAPSKAGGIAYVLDNAMRGYMQGRAQARQNEAINLEKKTQNSQALYNMAAQNLQGLIESYNVPPDQVQAMLKNPGQMPQGMDPTVYKQLMAANSVVQQAWGGIQQLYGSQVEDQTGKKGKSKGKKQDQQNPLQMITSQDPHEKIQGMYALWSKMPPPVYGSLYQAAQSATAKAQAIKTDAGSMFVQQAQNQKDQDYLGAYNQRTQIEQGTATMLGTDIKGMKEPGNLPIWNRPSVDNADGSHSSEYSVSFKDPKTGYEVLVPTIVNGRFLTPDGKKPASGSPEEKAMFAAAWQNYQQTGDNLGKFDSPADADAYATKLHSRGSHEDYIKKLDDVIDNYERSGGGNWKAVEYEDASGNRQTFLINSKDSSVKDGQGNLLNGIPAGWRVAPKAPSGKPTVRYEWDDKAKGYVSYQIDPETNQPIPSTRDDKAIPPASLIQHVRYGESFQTDAAGNVVEIPTTTTTAPILPGGAAPQGGGHTTRPSSGGSAPSGGGNTSGSTPPVHSTGVYKGSKMYKDLQDEEAKTNTAYNTVNNYLDALTAPSPDDPNTNTIKRAERGDGPAQVDVVASFIKGIVGGPGTGVRVTQTEWNQAVQTAPILQRIGAHFTDSGTYGIEVKVLSPQQIASMVWELKAKQAATKKSLDDLKGQLQEQRESDTGASSTQNPPTAPQVLKKSVYMKLPGATEESWKAAKAEAQKEGHEVSDQ